MSLAPTFEIGVWNAWIFTSYLLLFVPLYFLTKLKERDLPADFPLSDIERKIASAQNIGRIVVFIYPIFLPLGLGTIWFRIGLPICLLGMATGIEGGRWTTSSGEARNLQSGNNRA